MQYKLIKLVKKQNLDISDLYYKWSIKMNIKRNRREYLNLKVHKVVLREKYLETKERKTQWKNKSISLRGAIVLLENRK